VCSAPSISSLHPRVKRTKAQRRGRSGGESRTAQAARSLSASRPRDEQNARGRFGCAHTGAILKTGVHEVGRLLADRIDLLQVVESAISRHADADERREFYQQLDVPRLLSATRRTRQSSCLPERGVFACRRGTSYKTPRSAPELTCGSPPEHDILAICRARKLSTYSAEINPLITDVPCEASSSIRSWFRPRSTTGLIPVRQLPRSPRPASDRRAWPCSDEHRKNHGSCAPGAPGMWSIRSRRIAANPEPESPRTVDTPYSRLCPKDIGSCQDPASAIVAARVAVSWAAMASASGSPTLGTLAILQRQS
jgi:hypothetical protein